MAQSYGQITGFSKRAILNKQYSNHNEMTTPSIQRLSDRFLFSLLRADSLKPDVFFFVANRCFPLKGRAALGTSFI